MDLFTLAFLYFLHLNYWILWLIENDKASVVIRVCGWLEERDWAMTHILLAFYHSNDMRHETRLWASSVDIKVTPPAYSQLAWWSQWYCAQAGPLRKHLNFKHKFHALNRFPPVTPEPWHQGRHRANNSMQNSFTSFSRKPTLPFCWVWLIIEARTIITYQGAVLKALMRNTITSFMSSNTLVCKIIEHPHDDLACYGVCEKLNWSYLPLSEVCGWQMQNTEAELTKSQSQQSLSEWRDSRELFDPRITLLVVYS